MQKQNRNSTGIKKLHSLIKFILRKKRNKGGRCNFKMKNVGLIYEWLVLLIPSVPVELLDMTKIYKHPNS